MKDRHSFHMRHSRAIKLITWQNYWIKSSFVTSRFLQRIRTIHINVWFYIFHEIRHIFKNRWIISIILPGYQIDSFGMSHVNAIPIPHSNLSAILKICTYYFYSIDFPWIGSCRIWDKNEKKEHSAAKNRPCLSLGNQLYDI